MLEPLSRLWYFLFGGPPVVGPVIVRGEPYAFTLYMQPLEAWAAGHVGTEAITALSTRTDAWTGAVTRTDAFTLKVDDDDAWDAGR